MGKSTISMAIFNSYVKLPEGMIKTWNSGKFVRASSMDDGIIYDLAPSSLVFSHEGKEILTLKGAARPNAPKSMGTNPLQKVAWNC